jgi:hypothetical protein
MNHNSAGHGFQSVTGLTGGVDVGRRGTRNLEPLRRQLRQIAKKSLPLTSVRKIANLSTTCSIVPCTDAWASNES